MVVPGVCFESFPVLGTCCTNETNRKRWTSFKRSDQLISQTRKPQTALEQSMLASLDRMLATAFLLPRVLNGVVSTPCFYRAKGWFLFVGTMVPAERLSATGGFDLNITVVSKSIFPFLLPSGPTQQHDPEPREAARIKRSTVEAKGWDGQGAGMFTSQASTQSIQSNTTRTTVPWSSQSSSQGAPGPPRHEIFEPYSPPLQELSEHHAPTTEASELHGPPQRGLSSRRSSEPYDPLRQRLFKWLRQLVSSKEEAPQRHRSWNPRRMARSLSLRRKVMLHIIGHSAFDL